MSKESLETQPSESFTLQEKWREFEEKYQGVLEVLPVLIYFNSQKTVAESWDTAHIVLTDKDFKSFWDGLPEKFLDSKTQEVSKENLRKELQALAEMHKW